MRQEIRQRVPAVLQLGLGLGIRRRIPAASATSGAISGATSGAASFYGSARLGLGLVRVRGWGITNSVPNVVV